MVEIQKISEIEPRLGFTEFDMLKKYRQSFATSELGRLHVLFSFSELARQMHLKSPALGRKSYFSPEGKIALMILKPYTNFSDSQLIERLNCNIHYQLFCGVQIDPLHPPYLENLHVCMTDATCYESHLRFPIDVKLLWEVLYGFIVICANIAGYCIYNISVTSILM